MKLVSILFVLFLSTQAFSAQSQLIYQPYLSAHVMGRGGTITSVADNYETLMFNPAGLARFEKHDINLKLSLEGTPSILTFYSDITGAGSNPTSQQNVILNHLGDHYASRVGIGGIGVWPTWGVALIPLDLSVELDVGGSAVGVQAYQDTVLMFGKAWNLNDEKTLNLGMATKVIYRGYVEKDLTVFDLAAGSASQIFLPSDAQEGLGFDFDFGALYTMKVPEEGFFKWLKYAKPTFGVAVRNILDNGFRTDLHLYSASSSLTSTTLERRVDVGTRFDLPPFWVFTPRVMVEARDMFTRYATFTKCFHVGTELFWKAFSWLEGSYEMGFSEGYLTFGLSGQIGIFRADLASYSEEIGSSGSPKENRRYIAQLSLDF